MLKFIKVASPWEATVKFLQLYEIKVENGEGNGTPLQYFCLENPMEGGAW